MLAYTIKFTSGRIMSLRFITLFIIFVPFKDSDHSLAMDLENVLPAKRKLECHTVEENEEQLRRDILNTKFKILYKHLPLTQENLTFHNIDHRRQLFNKSQAPKIAISYLERAQELKEQDASTAFFYCLKSAEFGYIDAIYELAKHYTFGIGTDINESRALQLVNILAKQNHALSIIQKSICYAQGRGTKKNIEEAINIIIPLISHNHPVAQYQLALYFMEYGKQNLKAEAIELLKKSALNQLRESQFLLGRLYYEGKDIPQDIELGKKLLQMARDKNCRFAKEYISQNAISLNEHLL